MTRPAALTLTAAAAGVAVGYAARFFVAIRHVDQILIRLARLEAPDLDPAAQARIIAHLDHPAGTNHRPRHVNLEGRCLRAVPFDQDGHPAA